jgi:hypothetical protein
VHDVNAFVGNVVPLHAEQIGPLHPAKIVVTFASLLYLRFGWLVNCFVYLLRRLRIPLLRSRSS